MAPSSRELAPPPAFFIVRWIVSSPATGLISFIVALATICLLGNLSILIGHACLRHTEAYAAHPEQHFNPRSAAYVGEIGALILSPLFIIWCLCMANTYETVIAASSEARAQWFRHAWTGVYLPSDQKARNVEAREEAYERWALHSELSWLIFVPLSMFSAFFLIGYGAAAGAIGSAATSIGNAKHCALAGTVGGAILGCTIILVASLFVVAGRARGIPLPLSQRYEERYKAEEDRSLEEKAKDTRDKAKLRNKLISLRKPVSEPSTKASEDTKRWSTIGPKVDDEPLPAYEGAAPEDGELVALEKKHPIY